MRLYRGTYVLSGCVCSVNLCVCSFVLVFTVSPCGSVSVPVCLCHFICLLSSITFHPNEIQFWHTICTKKTNKSFFYTGFLSWSLRGRLCGRQINKWIDKNNRHISPQLSTLHYTRNLLPPYVQLEKSIRAEGSVELWLMKLLQMSQQSVHGIIRQAHHVIQDPDLNVLRFLEQFPAQVNDFVKP